MSKKILVVDDHDSITRIVAKTATSLGYEVLTINDPTVAFAAFDRFNPDVLMIDLVMPEVDGIDILHEILALGTTARIVVMSGHGQTYLRLGKEVGTFHDCPDIVTLAKPFRRSDLVNVLAAA